MVLDKEEHRAILLELINATVFPGKFLDKALEVRESIKTARIEFKEHADLSYYISDNAVNNGK